MREHLFILIAGFVFLIMVVFSVSRMNQIRTNARQNRPVGPPKSTAPSLDPNRYSVHSTKQGGDGAPMVVIPGGVFVMGTRGEVGEYDEKPSRKVTLKSYFIDVYEVTNERYERFVRATGHRKQNVMIFFDDLSQLMGPTQPAVGVSWFDAAAYCSWAGGRLPTEAEWELAARGEDERQWPWGNQYREGYANVRGNDDGYQYTAPVGSFEAGRSPYGLYDMAGNLSEWVYDWYDEFYYKEGQVTLPKGPESGKAKVLRGGSWNDPPNDSRTSKRTAISPERSDAIIGFRCAEDPPEIASAP
jgi:sulfatase modifying factor 1